MEYSIVDAKNEIVFKEEKKAEVRKKGSNYARAAENNKTRFRKK